MAMVGSHALLLRLFQSSSYFSVHLALQYLSTYSDHIGITHYLTGRLRELEAKELDDVWGFICHLLVTRPSSSCALETFVVERSEQSTHTALLTLWFMQASLTDLSGTRRNTPSFAICQRTLLKVQNIIFGDPPLPSSAPYQTLVVPSRSRFWRRRVKPRIGPALVGIGSVLAGAPGMPRLTPISGNVAIEQGRAAAESSGPRPFNIIDDEEHATHSAAASIRDADVNSEIGEDDISSEEEDVEVFGRTSTMSRFTLPEGSDAFTKSTPVIHGTAPKGASLSRRTTIGASRTSPSLVRPRIQDRAQEDRTSTPSYSTPSLALRKSMSMSETSPDALLQNIDPSTQLQMLRSHYCRSEVHFLLTLENISNRLLVVPKLARVSALRAELTALNHKLPAEVDIPMWTSVSDTLSQGTSPTSSTSTGHSRIVRIPPGESVVLNSAERAPYLLLIEVLSGDLDFNPSKRANKEVLKKILAKESGKSAHLKTDSSSSASPFSSTSNPHQSHDTREPDGDDLDKEAKPILAEREISSVSFEPQEEEMDLVEQLYGADLSVRSKTADLSDSIVLPPAPKNKALDIATWSKISPSAPPSPSPSSAPTNGFTTPDARLLSTTSHTGSPSSTGGSVGAIPHHLSLEDYSERMRTAAVMLAQLNSSLVREPVTTISPPGLPPPPPDSTWSSGALSLIPGSGWITKSNLRSSSEGQPPAMRMKLQYSEATAIRDKIMEEMMALEEERMQRMKETAGDPSSIGIGETQMSAKTMEDEGIVRRELNKVDPSAAVFRESWLSKKARIRAGSPYGHLASWDCISVIVKTGADLRQEQMAVQLIQIFERIWRQENCACWVRYFRILITGGNSGLVETITDAVSIHSIKKAEYARRLADGQFGHVTLLDHFIQTYGDPSSAKFARAQRCFAKSLAGYSVLTYLLQIKDRHNGNILLDREGHLVHIDFGFLLSNSPGNMGFEAAPFKFPLEYVDVLGGIDSEAFKEFKRLFREGFEAARKHCDSIITIVELMQKDSALPCFAAFGEQTSRLLLERFQQGLPHSAIGDHVDKLIMSSVGSAWTRLYDSFQYYSQSIL